MVILIILVFVGAVVFLFRRTSFKGFTCKSNKTTVLKDKIDISIPYTYSAFELDLITLINKHRDTLGLQEVKLNDYMSNLCLEHNKYMAEKGKASHDNFDIRSKAILDNLEAQSVNENVAYNYSTPSSTLNAWLNSEGHRKNIENPKWNLIGVSNFSKFSTNLFAHVKN